MKDPGCYSISREFPWDAAQRGRFRYFRPEEFPAAVRFCFWEVFGVNFVERRIEPVETVDVVDLTAGIVDDGGEVQQAEGSHPEVIRGEIVYPGVYEKESLRSRHFIFKWLDEGFQVDCTGWYSCFQREWDEALRLLEKKCLSANGVLPYLISFIFSMILLRLC